MGAASDGSERSGVVRAALGEQVGQRLPRAGRYGHHLGLEVHEAPWVKKDSEDVLEAGHVVTIEPGVYLPGKGGVRIEDMVLVTEDGNDVLTRSTKEMRPA